MCCLCSAAHKTLFHGPAAHSCADAELGANVNIPGCECIDLGCLLGRMFVVWHWLRKSTFTLPELLSLTANSRGKHAQVYKAFGGYHLLVRRFSACWQGVPWGMQLTNGAAGPHDAVVILSFSVIGQLYQDATHGAVGASQQLTAL